MHRSQRHLKPVLLFHVIGRIVVLYSELSSPDLDLIPREQTKNANKRSYNRGNSHMSITLYTNQTYIISSVSPSRRSTDHSLFSALLSLILLLQLDQFIFRDWRDRNITKVILAEETVGVSIHTHCDSGEDDESGGVLPEEWSSRSDHGRRHLESSWVMVWGILAARVSTPPYKK